MNNKTLILFLFLVSLSCGERESNWQWGPFIKIDTNNPILEPLKTSLFFCPVRYEWVNWEFKDVFNPAAINRNDTTFLIYRAEDTIGIYNGTSRLGLAFSMDGVEFERLPQPVFFPDSNEMVMYEWEGGVEDPRIVQREDGLYVMTYTAYDGTTARLCLASSSDLKNWMRHGLVLGDDFKDTWSKSGAIVTSEENGIITAKRIDGKYWMYWGDLNIHASTSEDLISWDPVVDSSGELVTVFGPRTGYFDSRLVEPGPPPILTEQGILMLYNSMNAEEYGDPGLPPGTYAAGQILLDPADPLRVLSRSESYFIKPEKSYELTGQVNQVCFIEGLVKKNDRWLVYYGTADSKIAVAYYADHQESE